MEYFVTNHDILQIFPNCKIVKYAVLDQYETIYDLLPNQMDFVFLNPQTLALILCMFSGRLTSKVKAP